jgi:hypothetical protein
MHIIEGRLEACRYPDAAFTVQSCCTKRDNDCQAMSSHLTVPTSLHVHVPWNIYTIFLPLLASGEAFNHSNGALSVVLIIQK